MNFLRKNRSLTLLMTWILLLTLTVLPLVSCSETGTDGKETENAGEVTAPDAGDPSADSTEEVTEEADVWPIEVIDMGGKTMTICTQDWYGYYPLDVLDITAEEYNGEPLNDAAFDRQLKLEEMYKCTIKEYKMTGFTQDYTPIINSIQADESAYDLILLRSSGLLQLMTGGLLYQLDDVSYLNPEADYWDLGSWDNFALGGKHYVISGDFSTQDDLSYFCTFFNKNIIEDMNMESPYELVKNGTWTLEKMYQMGEEAKVDVNNDGKMNKDDNFGVSYIWDMVVGVANGLGVTYGNLDEEGKLVMNLKDEYVVDRFLHIVDIMFDRSVFTNSKIVGIDELGIFTNARTLFTLGGVYYAATFREMDNEFGIIPYPKYNEEQESYYTGFSNLFWTGVVIPITNPDLKTTGIFMEAFAYEGMKSVVPAFYETLLLRKVARDEESQEMFGMIFDSVMYDIGALINPGGLSNVLSDMVNSYNKNIVSGIERKWNAAEGAIETLMDAIASY